MSFDDTFEKQLSEAYDKSARYFAQLFNATIIFALAFLAFILVPLVALQREDAHIGEQLLAAQAETNKAEAEQTQLATEQVEAKALLEKLPAQREELVRRQAELSDRDAELAGKIEAIELSLDKVAQEQGRLEELSKSLEQLAVNAENLQPLDVDGFVRALQDFLRQSADVIWNGAPLENLDFAVDCPGSNPDERANCVIRAKVMQMLTAAEQDLRDKIIAPITRIDSVAADGLEARLKETNESFGHVLDEQPGFWQEVVQKRDVGQGFANEIAQLSKDVQAVIFDRIKVSFVQTADLQMKQSQLIEAASNQQAEIRQLQEAKAKSETEVAKIAAQIAAAETRISTTQQKIEQLKSKVADSKDQIAMLTAAQAKIVADRQGISDRMKGVQSPFGALPIGLTEAVQVFPIIVAGGLVMALLTLASAMRLRGRYHLLLRKIYPQEAAEVDERIVLTAPLFLDPHRRFEENAWRGAVLVLPFIIYGVSILLIAESQRLAPQPEGTGRLIENGYFWLYLVVAGLLLLPLYQIARIWSKYDPAPGKVPASPARLPSQAGS